MHRPVSYFPLLILPLLLLLTPATSLSWPAKVASVTDGDMIKVIRDDRQVTLKLYGIHTPEKGQQYGQQVKTLTAALAGKMLRLYRRILTATAVLWGW